jgi:hypothetical protein
VTDHRVSKCFVSQQPSAISVANPVTRTEESRAPLPTSPIQQHACIPTTEFSMTDTATQQTKTRPTAQEVRALLDAQGITFADCVGAFGSTREDNAYVLTAHHLHEDAGEVEFDDKAVVSDAEQGAWVMAWVWVARSDAENYPERLEQLLSAARSLRDLTAEQRAHLDWVKEVATDLADDIDRIMKAAIPTDAVPTAILWEDGDGNEFTFLPSTALGTLIATAAKSFAPSEHIEAIELFARTFGPKLDCLAGVAAVQAA